MAAAKMSRKKRSWSDAPIELLSDIAERLETRSEILSFRAVCKAWQASAPLTLAEKTTILSPILPHRFSVTLRPHHFKFYPSNIMDHRLVLVASSVFLVQSIENPELPPWLFTVEEFNPGKLYLRRPLSRLNYDPLPENFPKNVDMLCFRVSEISRLYNLSYAPNSVVLQVKNRNSFHFSKVIFDEDPSKCGNKSSLRLDECTLTLLFDDGSPAALAKIKLKDGAMSSLHGYAAKRFDDIVNFKGRVCAVDRKGRTYWVGNGLLGRVLAVDELVGEGLRSPMQRRLVESRGKLYLVYACPRGRGVVFKVYKLNEGRKKWEELEGIGDDRILFATQDGCFFVPAEDIPTWRGNCLVFGKNVFPAYGSYHNQDDMEICRSPEATATQISVFDFGTGECKPIEYYPDYSKLLQPQTWLSSDTCLSRQKNSTLGRVNSRHDSIQISLFESLPVIVPTQYTGSKKGGEAEKDYLSENCRTKEASCPLGYQVDTQAMDITDICDNISAEDVGHQVDTQAMNITDIRENISAEDVGHQVDKQAMDITDNRENISAEDVGALGVTTEMHCDTTIVPDSAPTALKSLEIGVSKTKFEGIDVSSDLLPTLKEIWAKHGNILERHQVRSNDLVGWALESTAKVVILLPNTSDGSLSDSEADYLSSTLHDLQLMRFNVSWLVPSVKKALNMHKCMANRAKLEGKLKGIEKVSTEVADMKTKFLAEVGGLEQMSDEQRKNVCESLSVLTALAESNY